LNEFIDGAAGYQMIEMSLIVASDFGDACVIGVFDPAIAISAGYPVLLGPKVEGKASLPRQNRSNNETHNNFLLEDASAIRAETF
jgi:hypothetical protein